jgi:hypothetical protein
MPQRGASAPRHIGHFVDRTPSRKRNLGFSCGTIKATVISGNVLR